MKQGATKFMIMGVARSGTTWLADLLHSHSDIICAQEPFHHSWEGRRARHRMFWNDEDFFLHKANRPEPEGKGTYVRARKYLKDKVWTLPAPVVGFKGLVSNLSPRDDLARYLHRMGDDLHTLWMARNPIRCCLSGFHARKLNQWASRKRNQIKHRPVVDLAVGDVVKAIERIAHANRHIRRLCSNILVVEYKELLTNHYETMGQVLHFLHVRPWACSTDYLRLQPGELRKLISNFDELKEQLPDEYRHYLDEEEIL